MNSAIWFNLSIFKQDLYDTYSPLLCSNLHDLEKKYGKKIFQFRYSIMRNHSSIESVYDSISQGIWVAILKNDSPSDIYASPTGAPTRSVIYKAIHDNQ